MATIRLTTIITFITSALIISLGSLFMKAFTSDETVISIGREYLTIVSLFYIIFAMMFIYNGVMRGAGDTLIPMLITLLSLWIVRVPLAWFLSDRLGNESGIWWSFPAGWLVGLILAWSYYKTGNWKKKVIVKPGPL
jgi:Na+-driven multidrug efflux pump